MSSKERLKDAYENVSFSADTTWTNQPNAYHRSNMELCVRENELNKKDLCRNRPRTVRESIPKSRLAQYANFAYNESREMSYASSSLPNFDLNLASGLPSEPWEMPEVVELYKWFLKNQPEDHFSRLKFRTESPLLTVSGFEDKILKIKITEDRVKNIWKKDFGEPCNRSEQVVVNFFTSPMKFFYLFGRDGGPNYEWFRNISVTRDLLQLQQWTKSFDDQISKLKTILVNASEAPPPPTEPISTEILYSEVLQGRKHHIPCKSEPKILSTSTPNETLQVSQETFTNYTILSNNQRLSEVPPPPPSTLKSDGSLFPKAPVQFTTGPSSQIQTGNKFVPQKTPTMNVYFQSENPPYQRYKSQTNQFLVDSSLRQNRTVVHPSTTSCVQQTFFYQPAPTVSRWVPPNLNSYYPTQIITRNWYTQNPVIPNPMIGVPPSVENRSNLFLNRKILESSQCKEKTTEESEEHPVSTSISDELEIQALEQYSNSNENFYQELERQAAEQYASSPE